MRVFLTGATGYIGSVVAEALKKHGHTVLGLARSNESADNLQSVGVTPVRGSLYDFPVIAAAATESDAVIHLASTNGPDAPAADRQAVETIISALEGTEKPFVYTSGIFVTGNTGDRVADEDTPLDPTPLVSWRPEVEKLVLNAANRGVRSVVIRPAVVYGRNGGMVTSFLKSARETGTARFVGTGENRWPLVHVDDLAELYVLALESAKPRTILYAAHGPSIRVSKIAEAASRCAGAEGRTRAWPLEEARKELGPFADALVLDQQISSARAIRDYSWTPVAPSLLEELDHGSYRRSAANSK
jgi:nucleoside-diphosphate-sugar epimerase